MSTPNAEKDVEIVGHSDITEENIEWYSLSGKQFSSFFKNKQENRQKLNVQLPYNVVIELSDVHPRERKT